MVSVLPNTVPPHVLLLYMYPLAGDNVKVTEPPDDTV